MTDTTNTESTKADTDNTSLTGATSASIAHAKPEPPAAGPEIHYSDKPEGPVSAAVLAGGIGALAMGAITTLSEASTSIADKLNWNSGVGPLSGKTILAVVVWLIAWAILYAIYRGKQYETRRALTIALVLIAVGILATFPPFFELFS